MEKGPWKHTQLCPTYPLEIAFSSNVQPWVGTGGTARDILTKRYRVNCNRLVIRPRLQEIFRLPHIEVFRHEFKI